MQIFFELKYHVIKIYNFTFKFQKTHSPAEIKRFFHLSFFFPALRLFFFSQRKNHKNLNVHLHALLIGHAWSALQVKYFLTK